jgi:hypothetical protein
VSPPDPQQISWDLDARLLRVQRIEAQLRLIDVLERELREAVLKVACIRRRHKEAKWELSRLTVNLAVLAPPVSTGPPPAADDHADDQARPPKGRGRGRKAVRDA